MSGKNTGHAHGDPTDSTGFEPPTDVGGPTFPFESFAQSEADAATADAARHDGGAELAPPVEKRRILRRSYLPPGDVVVDTRPVGNMILVTLRGRINESFRGGELGRSLSGVVVFDLAEVDRVSSFGVKGWLQMLDTSNMVACYFYRCSEAVINQITMMRNFCGPGRIHSLMVPYACASCGEEFGALYEAVADREYLLGRSPARAECPRCGRPAEMDDDPWSYFALDEHLLDAVPPDLQQVIDHLHSSHRTDPIEKFISAQETRIRFNAALDGRLRFRRAFAGLEGRVTLDLSVTPFVDPAGIQRLLGALRDLDSEVSEVWLDGAPADLIRALLADPVPGIYVSSMFVEARCLANGIQRPVLVDIERQRAVLQNRGLPPIEANWAVGPVDVADTDVLFQAAADLGPNDPIPFAAPGLSLGGQPPAIDPAMTIFGLHPWQVALGTASTVLIAMLVMILAVVSMLISRGDLLAFGDASGSLSRSAAADGWDGGAPLPPPWVDQPFQVGDALVVVVGSGTDTDVDTAAELSRIDAIYRLVFEVRSQVAEGPARRGLADVPPDVEPQRVVDRFLHDIAEFAAPTRSKAAIKREGQQITVVTQHQISSEAWQGIQEMYGETSDFRGLSVARRFPSDFGLEGYLSTPLVATAVPSWFSRSASVGDGLLSIAGRPVESLEDFSARARRAWASTPPGKSLTMELYRGSELAKVGFAKPAGSLPPPPSLGDLPLLDLEEP